MDKHEQYKRQPDNCLELEEVEEHVADDVDVHAPGIARPGGPRDPQERLGQGDDAG